MASVQIAERAAERRLRWDDLALLVDPQAQIVEQRPGVPHASDAALLCGVACDPGFAFDGEDAGDLAHALDRDGGASGTAGSRRAPRALRTRSPTVLTSRGQ